MYDAGLTISCSTGIKTESILTAGEIADRDATGVDVVNQEGVTHFGEIVAGYARGSIIRGGVAYWEVHDAKTNHFILVGDGTDIVSKAFDWDDMAAGAAADMVHTHGSAAEGGVALGPLDSLTMADDAWIGIGAALERIVFDAAGDIAVMGAKFGIGTLTVPHGGIGGAMLAIDGANASLAAGPLVQFTTDSDDYPLVQLFNWQHDNIGIVFDAYWDGAWRSSDAGSNFKLYKTGDKFRIMCDSGIAAGNVVTWIDAITVLPDAKVGMSNANPGAILDTTAVATLQVGDGVGAISRFISIKGGANREAMLCVENDARMYRFGISTDDQWHLFDDTANLSRIVVSVAGAVQIPSLAGVGVRAVVADAAGNLSAP